MDVVSSVISILSPAVNPIIRQARYAFKVSENVNALCVATKELLAMKTEVAEQIQLDTPKERKVTKQVQEWMDHVDTVEKEVHEIEERYKQGSCQFFKGFSLNYFSNYAIGKAAFKKLSRVQGLCDKRAKFERVTIEQLPLPVQMLHTITTISSNQNTNLERAFNYIINDNSVRIIGIWGMGGVGKTHLLKQINNSFGGNYIFDHVIFVRASKEWSVEKIQIAIAKRLKLELNDHDDDELRANKIFNFLSRRGFLLLLDDVWDRVDLAKVGISFPLSSKQKVVLTTRFLTVCCQMKTKKEIRVDCLNKEDAWRLFKDKVGVVIQSNPNIRDHAEDLVRELDGLPLTLITIGRSMRGKSDSRDWKDAIQLLRASRLPEIEECTTEESLFKELKFLHDILKSDILRECFLACSLWPEDYEIEKTDLIQLWLGLGIVEELGNPDIYSHGYALIRNLLDTCLLEACQNEYYVKMHHVLRDMALWIARDCGKNMNKWIIKDGQQECGSSILLPNDIWCKAEYITLWNYDEVLDIPSIVSKTNLKTLIISCCQIESTSTNGIHNFPYLTFLDLSHNNLIKFPKKICQVVNLRYLNLSNNKLNELLIDLKFLINLRYLFLSDNYIREVPSGVFSKMEELLILDLVQYWWVSFNNSNVLKDIKSLKKIKALTIGVSDNSELQRLSDLVHLPVRELEINYINFEADNSILITPSFLGESDRQKELLKLSFHDCPGKRQLVFENSQRLINWRFQNLIYLSLFEMLDLENVVYKRVEPKDLFSELRELRIHDCLSIKNFSWIVYLQCLRVLEIKRADPSVHKLFTIKQPSSSQSAEIEKVRNEAPINKTFPSLEIMQLHHLPNVKSICPPAITFPSLKELHVVGCSIARLPFNRITVPCNLERIEGRRRWWDRLEWEDEELKSLLEKKFKE